MKFNSETPNTNQYGSSNKYNDTGFSSGGSTETSQSSNYGSDYGSTYGSSYGSTYQSSSSNKNAETGIPTNIKVGLGLGVVGAVVMMYKPGSGAKVIKQATEASKTTKKPDFKSVAEQMQSKFKSTAEQTTAKSTKATEGKAENSSSFDFGKMVEDFKKSCPWNTKNTDKSKTGNSSSIDFGKMMEDFNKSCPWKDTKNTDKLGEKIAADNKIMGKNFQKKFDDLRKDADKHFSKSMSEESKATAEEQKKQINEAMNQTKDFLNKAFASNAKTTEKTTTEEKATAASSSGESFFDKFSKEIGMADFFDKHESGGFEPSDDKKGMSLQEARKILQFDASNPNIKKDDITKNFRIISRQNHPDLGGSAYLASKVNEARETLLKHNKKTQRRR